MRFNTRIEWPGAIELLRVRLLERRVVEIGRLRMHTRQRSECIIMFRIKANSYIKTVLIGRSVFQKELYFKIIVASFLASFSLMSSNFSSSLPSAGKGQSSSRK